MTSERKETIRMIVIGLLAMLALPLVYRIWITYNPPPARVPQTLGEILTENVRERAAELVGKPPPKWTDQEKAAEPLIFAWLQAKRGLVLPWEWTDDAAVKDPAGYRACWKRCLDDDRGKCGGARKACEALIRGLDGRIAVEGTLYAHLTNELASVDAQAATNAYPCTISYAEKKKGMLWGWNTKNRAKACPDAAAARALRSELAAQAESYRKELDGKLLPEKARAEAEAADLDFRLAAIGRIETICAEDAALSARTGDLKKILVDVITGSRK